MAPYYYMAYPSSFLEINSENTQIAFSSYDETRESSNIFFINTELDLSSLIEIRLGNLILQPDYELLHEPTPINEAASSSDYLGFLINLERKVSMMEYSPNGRFLYFCYGGYYIPDFSHVTYVGQIDLYTTAPTYDVRVTAEIPPGPFNYENGIGGDIATYTSGFHKIIDIQKSFDGNIYFSKRESSTLYMLNNPDEPIEQMLSPGEIILSNEENNISIQGKFYYLPSGIDGYNYIDPLKFDLGEDTCILKDETIRIYGPEAYETFLWQDGSTNRYYDVSEEGVYTVVAFDIFGCSYTDSIFVNEIDANDLFIGNDTTACGDLAITLDPGEGFLSYQWHDGSTEQTFLADSAGTFWVEVETGCGAIRDSIIIEIGEVPEFNLGNDTTICNGDYLTLIGPPQPHYLWHDGTTDPLLVARDKGIYWLQVTDDFGCTFRDSIYLTTSSPEIMLPPDTILCDNDSILLIAGNNIFEYLWFDGSMDTSIWIYSQGTYSVIATDSLGCTNTDHTIINHINSPVVELGQDTGFCDYDTLHFIFDEPYTTYVWNGDDTTNIYIPHSGGEYRVYASNRCGETSDTIILEKYFSPQVFLGPDTILFPGQEILLDAGTGHLSYLWSNGNNTSSIYISEPGDYYVSVWNEHCKASDSIAIKRVSPFLVPNVFTPNNDGYNDDFEILGEHTSKFQLVILNRWGETLYETNDITLRWDGTYQGRQCADGVYFWIIKYQYPTEKTLTTIQGTITLLTD